jgi:hypothetical protein
VALLILYYLLYGTQCSTNSAKPCVHLPYGVCLKATTIFFFLLMLVLFLSITVDLWSNLMFLCFVIIPFGLLFYF